MTMEDILLITSVPTTENGYGSYRCLNVIKIAYLYDFDLSQKAFADILNFLNHKTNTNLN